jgi:ClpP class serine protease
MPALNELIAELNSQHSDDAKAQWLNARLETALRNVSDLRDGANVIFYASAFLQKPGAPSPTLSITHEDINGFMTAIHGMDCGRGLELLLHTPGGVTNPTYAISAGTMISLACNRVVMGKQSQLGPIDSQMMIGGRSISAQAIVDQFQQAKMEILKEPRMAHVWAPILRSLGPALVEEARRALRYGEDMVCDWLSSRMLADLEQPVKHARKIARHFNGSPKNSSHGRRIDGRRPRPKALTYLPWKKIRIYRRQFLRHTTS